MKTTSCGLFSYTYDPKGNLLEVREKASTGSQPHPLPNGDLVTSYDYDVYGNRRHETVVMGGGDSNKVTEYTYDTTHNAYLVSVRNTVTVDGSPRTLLTQYGYDLDRGLRTSLTDANLRLTTYDYYQDRKLKHEIRSTDGRKTDYLYDNNGNLTRQRVLDSLGAEFFVATYAYDALNRLEYVYEWNNGTAPGVGASAYATTQYTYDARNNLLSQKDARNLTTSYTYDNLNRLTRVDYPNGDFVESRYDDLNNKTKEWTSKWGNVVNPAISYVYDNLQRVTSISYLGDTFVSYTYDLNDNRLTMITSDGTLPAYTYTYEYDKVNRLRRVINGLLNNKTTDYTYDDASNRKTFQIDMGATYNLSYSYDEINRLITVVDNLAAKTASYLYYDGGQLDKVTFPTGAYSDYVIDDKNRVEWIYHKNSSNTSLAEYQYTYDLLDNPNYHYRYNSANGNTYRRYYTYDDLSRLLLEQYQIFSGGSWVTEETVDYTYDVVGNRLTEVSSTRGSVTYTYATNSNQLLSRTPVPEDPVYLQIYYTYDAEGNLQRRANQPTNPNHWGDFVYDKERRLIEIKRYLNSTLQQTVNYSYDGDGVRVKMVDNSGTTYFLYDGINPILELDVNKNVTAYYVYGADGIVYRKKTSGSYEYHHKDIVGGTGLITDAAQAVVASYDYYAFGSMRLETGSSDNTHKFTGKEYDSTFRLYYFVARYYDPYIGRFVSMDPARQGVNWYVYTDNNPLKYVDPRGEIAWAAIWALAETTADVHEFQGSYADFLEDPNLRTWAEATFDGLFVMGLGIPNPKHLKRPFAIATLRENQRAANAAEEAVRRLYGGSAQAFETPLGRRVVDNLANNVAMEVKVGRTSLTKRIQKQIAKDRELLKTEQVRAVQWHFFPSKTGVGPTEPLRQALEEGGIKIIIHSP